MIVKVKGGIRYSRARTRISVAPTRRSKRPRSASTKSNSSNTKRADRGEGGNGVNDSSWGACSVLGVDHANPADYLRGPRFKRQTRPPSA